MHAFGWRSFLKRVQKDQEKYVTLILLLSPSLLSLSFSLSFSIFLSLSLSLSLAFFTKANCY